MYMYMSFLCLSVVGLRSSCVHPSTRPYILLILVLILIHMYIFISLALALILVCTATMCACVIDMVVRYVICDM